MNSGTVISFDPAVGYGFIRPAEGGRDVCVLTAALGRRQRARLHPGQAVDYDVTCDLAGTLLAINLKLRSAKAR